MFSDYFIDKICNIRDSIPSDQTAVTLPPPEVELPLTEFHPVSEQHVSNVIMSSASKSCDLDPMPTSLIKLALPELLPICTKLINKSLTTGTFPSCFKQALVTPLLKKSSLDPEVNKNYRPVSNLSFLSKVTEKVVAEQLNSHLTSNGLHEPFQSAYRQAHSTETALLKVHDDVTRAVGEQKVVLVVLLDLSAAFDTVSHEYLLSTLQDLGVQETALAWIKSYLTSRHQQVSIKGTRSDEKELTCGVPQGSVLGPILFNIYTSSLGRLLRQQLPQYNLYADDSTLYLCIKPKQLMEGTRQIEDCVQLVQRWMSSSQLKMNNDRTEFLLISSRQMARTITPPTLTVSDHEIKPSKAVCSLGVTLDRHATLEAHTNNICRQAYMQLKNISKLRRYLDPTSLECIVHAFVTSRLDYCNSLLCGLPSTLLARLQRVQNTAARILTGTPKYDHITPVLHSLHWLPVTKRIDFKILLLIFKVIHGQAPVYLQELITEHAPTRNLRSGGQCLLKVPYTSSSLVQSRAFSVAGPKLWNSLPQDIRTVKSLCQFKSRLKTHLFTQAYSGM
jgi:hypothetical protein